ncbi:MAG: hypothetical protein ACE5KV_02285 [Thermoplasmata archaeon]
MSSRIMSFEEFKEKLPKLKMKLLEKEYWETVDRIMELDEVEPMSDEDFSIMAYVVYQEAYEKHLVGTPFDKIMEEYDSLHEELVRSLCSAQDMVHEGRFGEYFKHMADGIGCYFVMDRIREIVEELDEMTREERYKLRYHG